MDGERVLLRGEEILKEGLRKIFKSYFLMRSSFYSSNRSAKFQLDKVKKGV